MFILPGQMNLTYQIMTRQYSVFPNSENKAGMAAHAWTSSRQQTEAGESLQLQAYLVYIVSFWSARDT